MFHRIGSTEIYSFFFFLQASAFHISSWPVAHHLPISLSSCILFPSHHYAHVHSPTLFFFFFLFTHQYTLFQYERISCTHINIYTQHIYLSELRNLSSFFFFSPLSYSFLSYQSHLLVIQKKKIKNKSTLDIPSTRVHTHTHTQSVDSVCRCFPPHTHTHTSLSISLL